MTFEEYSRAITDMQAELQRIAEATAQDPLTGPSDAAFEALLQRHVELVKLSTQLTERMFTRYKARP